MSLVQKRKDWIGHDYTKCPYCINRVKYCGCFLLCNCCQKHATDCKNEECKNCRKKGIHYHYDENGKRIQECYRY